MAKLIDDKARFVPTWIEAVKHLGGNGRQTTNLVLQIDTPTMVTKADQLVLAAVDGQLRAHSEAHPRDPELSINTVAATIFPQAVYRRWGAPALYEKFPALMERGQRRGTWGTYAMRMMKRKSPDGHVMVPLRNVVEKMHAAVHGGKATKSNYELGLHQCYCDADFDEAASELSINDPFKDTRDRNIPCLSHLTFKLLDGKVHLTAIYRTHYYCQRALGNLKGLSQLLSFVAAESGAQVGSLTCVSTLAVLDLQSWTSVSKGAAFAAALEAMAT